MEKSVMVALRVSFRTQPESTPCCDIRVRAGVKLFKFRQNSFTGLLIKYMCPRLLWIHTGPVPVPGRGTVFLPSNILASGRLSGQILEQDWNWRR